MIKIILAILLLPLITVCQVTLTQQIHEPIAGDTYIVSQLQDSVSTIPRSTGTNQVWDFSNIQTVSFLHQMNYVAPTVSFSNASVEMQYKCYISNTSPASWQYVGSPNQNALGFNFTDPETIMQWPFSYGSSFSDSFSYTGYVKTSTVDSFTAAGQRIVQGTGTGTVITPNGQVFTNVLQVTVRRYDTLFHSKQGPTFTEYDTLIERLYYVANRKFPILRESHGTSFTMPPGYETNYNTPGLWLASDLTSVGIEELTAKDHFNLYPIPCVDFLTVSSDLKKPLRLVYIFDIHGKLLSDKSEICTDTEHKINTTSLDEGIFFLMIQTSNETYWKKFIISR